MKLAIMQPYFFPYLGYWQLLNTVDRFVIYDDVNYIKGGWINRNHILINGKPSYITVPLNQASSNKRICDISLQSSPTWRRKMLKSIENTYRKTPFFSTVFPVIEKLINYETDDLAVFLSHNIWFLSRFIGIETELVMSSRCYQNTNLAGQDRVLDICRREGATTYINPQGGQKLYDTESFSRANIELRFLLTRPVQYKQRSSVFVPYLSIIDVLMEIGTDEIVHLMNEFELSGDSKKYTLKQEARHV